MGRKGKEHSFRYPTQGGKRSIKAFKGERGGTESNTPTDRALHQGRKKNRKGWDTKEIKSGCCQLARERKPAIRY